MEHGNECVHFERIEKDNIFRIAEDFSNLVGPRYSANGPFSGEALREILAKCLKEDNRDLIIIFDGVNGYGSSFLEEGFGGLVRNWSGDIRELETRLKLVSETALYRTYVMEATLYLNAAIMWRSGELNEKPDF